MAEVTLEINFLDLEAAGLTEQNFRGTPGNRPRIGRWIIPPGHRRALRPQLEAGRLDPERDVWSQEMTDKDGFRLTQYPD